MPLNIAPAIQVSGYEIYKLYQQPHDEIKQQEEPVADSAELELKSTS